MMKQLIHGRKSSEKRLNRRSVLRDFYIIKAGKFHGRLEIRNLSSRVEKYFNRPQCSLVKYFSNLCAAMQYPLFSS